MSSLNTKTRTFSSRTILGLIFAASLLLAACGGSTPPTASGGPGAATIAPTEAPTATEPPTPTEPAGFCANAYFPVVVGATWTYGGTAMGDDIAWTSTITAVNETRFTLTNQFDDQTATHQWECTADGLSALQYGSGPEVTLSAAGVSGTFETMDTVGVTMPKDIASGDTWEQSFNITGEMEITDGITALSTGTATQTYLAMGVENVSVPAGSFEAMKIETTISFELQLSMGSGGLSLPMNFTALTTNWWVADLGWVKSDSSAAFEGEAILAKTELENFSIP
ncbi:MAG: hypothetical protein WD740_04945 [Anaerolineales bacterium]